MDTGTYNCRDYHIGPHFSAATLTSTIVSNNNQHAHLQRHESWADLEHRSRSPASLLPKFPLLKLPLELRQQILLYLLPRTQELGSPHIDPLETHVRNFSAVQRRVRKGMELPPEKEAPPPSQMKKANGGSTTAVPSNIAWRRGNTALLAVCKQLHDECADLVYGRNTFMLGVTFAAITFRFRFLLPSGMAPKREYNLLDLMPERYLRRLRRVLVFVDHVDSYTGMIKYNVSGKGLMHGLRRQVARLACALQPVVVRKQVEEEEEREEGDTAHRARAPAPAPNHHPSLARVMVRISTGNIVTQSLKARFGEVQRVSKDIEEILEPFGHLCGVRDARIMGAVGHEYARGLEERMRGSDHHGEGQGWCCCCSGELLAEIAGGDEKQAVQLCVYGNDIS